MEKFMDIINQLVLEHKRDLSFYDIDNFQTATAQVLNESVPDALLPDPSKYCEYLDKIIGYVNQVTMTPEQLSEFYSKIYKSPLIDQKGITIPIQPMEDIDKIRPEYLSNIPMEFDKVVQGILKGTIKESEIRTKYVTGEYFNKLRKQIVKTSLPYNDTKDLMVQNTQSITPVSTLYIQATILPFLASYKQNVKDLVVIAENAKGRINNTYSDMMTSMRAMESLERSGKLDVKQRRLMSYFRYNMFRQYMSTCAYLVTLIIRKMKYYTFNIMSYINLYNTIYNYFPDGESILHEYVGDNDLKDIDDLSLLNSVLNDGLNVLQPAIQNALNRKKIELSNIMAKRHNTRLNYNDMENDNIHEYDSQTYNALNQIIMHIGNDLKMFDTNAQDPNMIVDDVLAKAHLDEPFISQYTDTLSRVDSMDFYTSQGSLLNDNDETLMLSLYSDLMMFDKNISVIATNISTVYKCLVELLKKFEHNTNELDTNTYNEYKETLENVMKNYKEFALQVTKKLMSRLDNMVTLLNDEAPSEDPSDPTPDGPNDYSTPSYLEAYDEVCEIEKIVFESLMKDYYAARKFKETGATVVFEDGTTPTVQTDASAQHSQNNANNDPKTANVNKEGIVAKFKKFMQELMDKFVAKAGRLTGINDRWLASVKADILALDTSNTTIQLAKYENVTAEKLIANIGSAINKVNGINAQSLPPDLKTKAKAETYVFADIPAKVGNEANFAARIKQFLTFGNTDRTDLVSYSGDDAKQKIQNIVQFCETYSNTYKNVHSSLKKLTDAAAKKQQEIINALGTQAQTTTTTTTNNNGTPAKPATTPGAGNNNGNGNGQPQTVTAESVIVEKKERPDPLSTQESDKIEKALKKALDKCGGDIKIFTDHDGGHVKIWTGSTPPNIIKNIEKITKDTANSIGMSYHKDTDDDRIYLTVSRKDILSFNYNESVYVVEADEQNQNGGNEAASKDKINASSMLTTVTREYTGAVLTILEKKYLDYIKVLNKLAPQKKTGKPDQGGKENNQEGNQG